MEVKKVGVIVTFNISKPGGGPRVTIDLINALNDLGKEVYLMTPFQLNVRKIEELHGQLPIKKIFYPNKFKKRLCRESTTSRLLMTNEFKRMANEVDLIIDMDGGILHNYLPKNKKYIVWRISCVYSELEKFKSMMKRKFKGRLKDLIKDILKIRRPKPSSKHHIHAVDKWTEKEMISFWHLKAEKPYLYPEIKITEFPKLAKKNQIVVFGRIAQNKMIETSIKIFSKSPKNYKLIIMGGETDDTEFYIKKLNNLINQLGIKERVEIIKSPSFEQLSKILAESKILIDSQEKISMTMTSIEAMAAGCIVLAIKNAGTYLDILEKGRYGFGFKDVKEGQKILTRLVDDLDNNRIGNSFIQPSIRRASDFDSNRFRTTLLEMIKKA